MIRVTRRLGDVSITCGLGLQYSDLAGGGGDFWRNNNKFFS